MSFGEAKAGVLYCIGKYPATHQGGHQLMSFGGKKYEKEKSKRGKIPQIPHEKEKRERKKRKREREKERKRK